MRDLIYTLFCPYLSPSLCSVVSWVIELLFLCRALWTKGSLFVEGRWPCAYWLEDVVCKARHYGRFAPEVPIFWAEFPSICVFYFLSRGRRLSKLVKCQRLSDGRERVSIRSGVRQTQIQILPPPQQALASWQVTLPISEKEDNGNDLTVLLGEGRV